MAKMAAANMYRVGDYVYFEANSTAPYQIRRIEELNKTNTGNVEAKVMCFFRRRDISGALLKTFDRCSKIAVSDGNHAKEDKADADSAARKSPDIEETPFIPGQEELNTEQRHLLVHRELFLSRQIETLPATHIRGKCTVALLNEVETPDDYLKKEDAFFYSLIYDPNQKTLVADKGEIRVGENFQAVPPEFVGTNADRPPRSDVMLYDTNRNLSDTKIDQYLIIARAIGTFARALDMVSAVKIPNLHISAAASVRDVTTQEAMNILHSSGYDLASAILSFVPMPSKEAAATSDGEPGTGAATNSPMGGPVLARDQLEEWSAAEANLFEEALEKYGKDFNDIRNDFLPWKSLKNIVEYYYMYKTTDRYVQQKRAKAAEAESRLKQVYIPTYTKPNPNIINSNVSVPSLSCESCKAATSEQWYAWGPNSAQLRLCKDCWSYWKRYGGLKRKHKYENFDRISGPQLPESVPAAGQGASKVNGRTGGEVMRWIRCAVAGCNKNFSTTQLLNQHLRRDHSANYANGIPSGGGRVANTSATTRQGVPPKTRSSIYLHTSVWTKVARRLAPKQLYNARHYARHPCEPINPMVIAQHCQSRPWKEIQNVAKLVARNPLPANVSITPPTATAKSATHSAKRKSAAHTSGTPPIKRGRENISISDYRSWITDGVKDCFMFSNGRVIQLRQKLTAGQVHRLARNPFKETKLIATHVLSKTESGGAMPEGND